MRLSIFASALTLLAALELCAGAEPAGKAAPEWDALFQPESGWIGADGAYSIPLSGDTMLWLFSDTFVGKVKEGKRLDARMINNSIALQHGTNQPEFFYGTAADGKPASFINPQSGSQRDYFWLTHGARTGDGLYFFLLRVVTVKPGTPFGFKLVDGWLAHVANPDASPSQWRITQTKVPFTSISAKGSLIFGNAVLREGGFVYCRLRLKCDRWPHASLPVGDGIPVRAHFLDLSCRHGSVVPQVPSRPDIPPGGPPIGRS